MVKLEVNEGRQSEEGSGVILSTRRVDPHQQPRGRRRGRPGRRSADQGHLLRRPHRCVRHIVGTDPGSDIAVVRAKGVSGLTPIAIGSSANLRVGQDVVAIGSPLGLEGTVTTSTTAH